MMKSAAGVLVAFVLSTTLAPAQDRPTRISSRFDLDTPARFSSSPADFARVGDRVYFSADDGIRGRELWKTDGTAEGTSIVLEIGRDHFAGLSSRPQFAAVGDLLFFVSGDSKHPGYLWRSDGTPEGTLAVTDDARRPFPNLVRDMTPVGGTLYFNNADQELWRSDGTVAGTGLVKDIRPGVKPTGLRHLIAFGDLVVFTAFDGTARHLWISDGTPAGTQQLLDQPLFEHELVATRDTLFFVADDESGNQQVWRSDGTRDGTICLTDFPKLPNGFGPRDLTVVGKRIFFTAHEPIVPEPDPMRVADYREELWKIDAAERTAARVPGVRVSSPSDLVVDGEDLLFAANAGSVREIWRLAAGKFGLTRAAPLPAERDVLYPADLIVAEGLILFSVRSGGTDAWISDGSTQGTIELSDSEGQRIYARPGHAIDAGRLSFFTTQDGHGGTALWRTDGTLAGTVHLPTGRLDPWAWHPADPFAHRGFDHALVDQTLFFAASTAEAGVELWKSDGTSDGTVMVKDINQTPPPAERE